jgi:hypothetical protein
MLFMPISCGKNGKQIWAPWHVGAKTLRDRVETNRIGLVRAGSRGGSIHADRIGVSCSVGEVSPRQLFEEPLP